MGIVLEEVYAVAPLFPERKKLYTPRPESEKTRIFSVKGWCFLGREKKWSGAAGR